MTSISSDVCETKERRDVSSQMAAAAAGRRIIHFSERGDRHGRKNNQTTKHLTLCVLSQVNPPPPHPPHPCRPMNKTKSLTCSLTRWLCLQEFRPLPGNLICVQDLCVCRTHTYTHTGRYRNTHLKGGGGHHETPFTAAQRLRQWLSETLSKQSGDKGKAVSLDGGRRCVDMSTPVSVSCLLFPFITSRGGHLVTLSSSCSSSSCSSRKHKTKDRPQTTDLIYKTLFF